MRIGIVGAGATGLAAGLRSTAMGHQVVVLEQSSLPGGRIATRRLHGCVVDNGGQYLRLPAEFSNLRRLVLQELPVDGLLDINLPVWTFDADGVVHPGDPAQNAEPKWTYSQGLDVLSARLAAGLDVWLDHQVAAVTGSSGGYRLLGDEGQVLLEADRILLTCPAPRVLELIRAEESEIEGERWGGAQQELETVRYRPVLSIVLGYRASQGVFAGGTTADPRPYYALVNTDRGHPISWLACENDKGPERVPPDMLVFVVQMAGEWSDKHFYDDAELLVDAIAALMSDLLQVNMRFPVWHDVTRWRYALPDTTCDLVALNRDSGGLVFAGDYVAGGRIHLALQAGLDAATLIGG